MGKDIKKVIQIEVGSAEANINNLKKEIEGLKESLGKMDKSSAEYTKTLKEISTAEDKLSSIIKNTNKSIEDSSKATEKSTASIRSLRKENSDLRDSLLNLKKGSEEYNSALNQIKENEERINSVMKATRNEVDALPGSYNALTKEMANLKARWKEVNDEAQRNELGKQILDINNKLKDLDASTGNFQRNVGDYKNAFKEAFVGIATGAVSATGAIGMVKAALSSLLANPVVLIATAFTALVNSIRKSKEAMDGINKGMKDLQPVIQVYKNLLAIIGETLGRLITA